MPEDDATHEARTLLPCEWALPDRAKPEDCFTFDGFGGPHCPNCTKRPGVEAKLREYIERIAYQHDLIAEQTERIAELEEDRAHHLEMLDGVVTEQELLGYRPDEYGGDENVVTTMQKIVARITELEARAPAAPPSEPTMEDYQRGQALVDAGLASSSDVDAAMERMEAQPNYRGNADDYHIVRTELEQLRARVAELESERALSLDRDWLGQLVRVAWIQWAETQENPKPSWLLPWSTLPEHYKEADRCIGEFIASKCVMPELLRVEQQRDEALERIAELEIDRSSKRYVMVHPQMMEYLEGKISMLEAQAEWYSRHANTAGATEPFPRK